MSEATSDDGIESVHEAPLALITLADPEGGNRLFAERLAALSAALSDAIDDPEVRYVLLRAKGGPGKPWCLGMDLAKLNASIQGDSDGDREGAVGLYSEVLSLIADSPKPVIALVGGPVMAGGVGLAGACDVVIATEGASFELSEIYYGLIPANVIPALLGRRMSLARLKYLILSAKKLSAWQALEAGLVEEILPEGDVENELKKVLRTFFRAEPEALSHAKSFLDEVNSLDPADARELARAKILELMASEPVGHALGALQSSETPRWFTRLKTNTPLFFG